MEEVYFDEMNEMCLCGAHCAYKQCCGLIHQQPSLAKNPEQLMRARFSAFCLHNAQFLFETHHPLSREPNHMRAIQASFASRTWLSLKIITAKTHTVEFVAFYKARPFDQLHELSSFVFEQGCWLYQRGEQLAPIRVNRNDLCPCASGAKYKKCCL